jgi:glucose/arabinose dehydrogenase
MKSIAFYFKRVVLTFMIIAGLSTGLFKPGDAAATTTQWLYLPLIVTPASLSLSLVPFASGFTSPVDIVSAGDDRLFVVEKSGTIRIVRADGSVKPAPFLDISARVGSSGSEQGLLGLVFHPAYAANGYFYVNYTDNQGDTHISRFSVTADPDVADPNSEFNLLTVHQPYSNHNGGDLHFGPDGYLYIGLGDGGSGGDPGNRAQSLDSLLGKILRIDVDQGSPYAIPPDNPFVDGDPNTLEEIWAYGLRNPWRFSFDSQTGDLFIGDVGQNQWEEIDYQLASSNGGENYGWRCYEGNHPYNLNGCGPAQDDVFPVYEYSHSDGCAVVGGYLYRGSQSPALFDHYIFGDNCGADLWSLTPDAAGGWQVVSLGQFGINPSSFGQGADGELYLAGYLDGTIYHLVDNSSLSAISTAVQQVTANSRP